MHIAVSFTLGVHPKVTFGLHKSVETAKQLSKDKLPKATPMALRVTVSNTR